MQYMIQIPWLPPQKIDVQRYGASSTFAFLDRLGRRCIVEGSALPYHVTVYFSRDRYDLTRFVVYGDWLSATYRAFDGGESQVLIYEPA